MSYEKGESLMRQRLLASSQRFDGRPASLVYTTVLALLALLIAAPGLDAQDWREQLARDAVAIKDGKMVYEEVGLIKIKVAGYEPAQFQVKVRSEAPASGVISRDNFVSLTAQSFLTFFLVAFADAYEVPASAFLEGFDYKELAAAIGTPDLEMNIVMTGEGIQFEFVNTATGERSRHTETWAQVFKR